MSGIKRCLIGLGISLVVSVGVSNAAEVEDAAKPCGAEPYRQFDFWLGKWTAFSKDGTRQGTNELTRVIGDCGLRENWIGAGGAYLGTSYNVYVPARQVWHQTWVDNQGGSLFLEGTFSDGAMRLAGTRDNAEGEQVIDRITWTPLDDGRVRQHWQASSDAGKTWQDVFDGYYERDAAD